MEQQGTPATKVQHRPQMVGYAIADALGEISPRARNLIRRTVEALGETVAHEQLAAAQRIEAAGGELRADGGGKRTLGGIYLRLVRPLLVEKGLDRRGLPPDAPRHSQRKKARASGGGGGASIPKTAVPWERRIEVHRALKGAQEGSITSMNNTFVGRPGKVVVQDGTAATRVKMPSPPQNLPSGVPKPPTHPGGCIIYMSAKQWNKVAQQIENDPNDVLIVEGWLVFDPPAKGYALFATSVKSKVLSQQQRMAKQAKG